MKIKTIDQQAAEGFAAYMREEVLKPTEDGVMDYISQMKHAVAMPRLVYAWEGEIEALQSRIKELEAEIARLREVETQWTNHRCDD